MNLFDSIGLNADPFSTSPNVDLFYPAVEHRQCLEGLELAIRMRRGLSVVKGGIGVGKTTISRKLIQNFKDEPDDFDFYLILDPKFESEIILLKHIIELFGVNDMAESVQECRNIIENHLLKVGVEQGKTLVLIIDEGQNLPGEMLDVFRTLLNFETDEFKLLQLIIFGQPEMGNMIHKYPNFEDRISFDFEIGPISIEDMHGMINHRIEVTGGKIGSWFQDQALLKIHKNTQGYPRKVTQLCHQLLLTMIGEEKKEINEEMVQRVISGKISTGGLLKQKKKNYNQIAVNKLLDVLKRDDKKEANETQHEEVDEDDWIGGEAPAPEAQVQNKSEALDKKEKLSIIEDTKPLQSDVSGEFKSGQKAREENQEVSENEVLDKFDNDLPSMGKYPPYLKRPLIDQIPLDQTSIGLDIDSGRLISCAIYDINGAKTLISYNIHSSKDPSLDPGKDPEIFKDSCEQSIKNLEEKTLNYGKIYDKSSQSIMERSNISFTLNHNRVLLQLVNVPKENRKDKKNIVEWTLKKEISFELESANLDLVNFSSDSYLVGVCEKDIIDDITRYFMELEWDTRAAFPIAQSIYNAFLWNYPEHQKKDTIIIHFGERTSLIICCIKSELKLIKPLFIGIQGLKDALTDNGLSEGPWHDRKELQVPETFMRSMGYKATVGKHDDILRPVFDNWRQEIDRTFIGIRKGYKISQDTNVLLSGSTAEIKYFDKFMEGTLGLMTNYLNPTRNLLKPEILDVHPSLLTVSIGTALRLRKSVNVLPKKVKQMSMIRWANRFGIVAAAATMIIFIGLSGWTKFSITRINQELKPIEQENSFLSYVEGKHEKLKQNKVKAEEQIEELSYDIEYFNRIIAINKFLSFYTPKEIIINELSFQEGWEVEAYKKIGRDLVKVVQKQDENLNIVRLEGSVSSNPALLESHFDNFVSSLKASGLFQNIDIMNESSKKALGNNNLQFELKCVI